MKQYIKNARDKVLVAKSWWGKGPPDPVYDSSVRVRETKMPAYIVVGLALVWVLANAAIFVDRAL